MHDAHRRLTGFTRAYNARSNHQIEDLFHSSSGVKLSPDAAMAAWCTTRRVFNEGSLDLLLLHHDRAVKVGKRGVRVTVAGEVYYYGLMQPELLPYQGGRRKVRPAYDPRDMRSVKVFDEIGGQEGAVGRQQMAALERKVRGHQKALKQVGLDGVIPAASLSALELMADRGELAPGSGVLEPVTELVAPVATGYDQAAKHVQRHELKAAAGAEHDHLPERKAQRPRPDLLARIDPAGGFDREDEDDAEPCDDDGPAEPLVRIGFDAPGSAIPSSPQDDAEVEAERPAERRDLLAELYGEDDE